MLEPLSKSPLQEKRLYLLTKYNKFVNRRAYTFNIQMKINIHKNRYGYFKEV
jgi:hypothetical protein